MKNLLSLIVIAGLFASCGNMNNNAGNMMANNNAANNEARVQAFYDQVFNAHNLAMADSFCTADFVDHNPRPGHTGTGLADLKAELGDFFAAFPDVHITTQFMASHGDTVIAKLSLAGTNTGPMMGMPPTGKSFNIEGVDIIATKNNMGTERWGYLEDMKMMMQMGMMPEHGMGDHKMEEGKMEEGKMMDRKMEKKEKKKK